MIVSSIIRELDREREAKQMKRPSLAPPIPNSDEKPIVGLEAKLQETERRLVDRIYASKEASKAEAAKLKAVQAELRACLKQEEKAKSATKDMEGKVNPPRPVVVQYALLAGYEFVCWESQLEANITG